jgi:hypothetical protein
MSLSEVLARLRGVHRQSGYYTSFCPVHDDRNNRSFSIRGTPDGKVLLHCFAGCSYPAIVAALNDSSPNTSAYRPPAIQPTNPRSEVELSELTLRIWHDSRPAQGTLLETYLRSRRITIASPPSLRFHPSLKHKTGGYLPAMVAAVQDPNGKIVAIHRTFLKADGTDKARVDPNKQMLGSCAGNAVWFAKPASTLAIAEGLETALSVAQSCPTLTVWATLSTSGMKALILPDIVRMVIITADADPPGEQAALAAAQRFMHEGREVKIARPSQQGQDFNDVIN